MKTHKSLPPVPARLLHEPDGTQPSTTGIGDIAASLTAAAATSSLDTGRDHELHVVVGQRCARREMVAHFLLEASSWLMKAMNLGTQRLPVSAKIDRLQVPCALVELRVSRANCAVSQTASARHREVMVGGRAIGVHLHATCSCDGQAQRRTTLAVAMRVSDCGSGRSQTPSTPKRGASRHTTRAPRSEVVRGPRRRGPGVGG